MMVPRETDTIAAELHSIAGTANVLYFIATTDTSAFADDTPSGQLVKDMTYSIALALERISTEVEELELTKVATAAEIRKAMQENEEREKVDKLADMLGNLTNQQRDEVMEIFQLLKKSLEAADDPDKTPP